MSSSASGEDPSFKSLLRRWEAVSALCLLVLASGFFLLRLGWGASFAGRWLVLSSIGLIYLLVVLRHSLPANHRVGETHLLPGFGLGNGLTILRGVLVAALCGFLFSPRPEGWIAWIPGLLYTLADAADYLDGFAARVTNHATRLGELLDVSLDGVGVLVAAALAVQYGQVPAWYLSVAVARYLFLGGMWLRRRMGKPNYELSPSISRRGFAGLQMGFLAVMLWPLFSPPGTHLAAAIFALPFLVGFLRDWLIVSGVLNPGRLIFGKWPQQVTFWLPVGMRLAILALSAGPLAEQLSSFQYLSLPGQVLTLLELCVVFSVVTGIAGRATAILGLLLLGFNQMQNSLTLSQLILVTAYTAILFMGSGPLSIWKPEEALISQRAGERGALPVERGG